MALVSDPSPLTLDAVRQIALALPGVEEGTAYGTVAFRVRRHFLCRLHDAGDALVVKVPLEERAALIDADPVTFFVNDHLAAHPYVLVRLETAGAAEVRGLLERAWYAAAPAVLRRQR